MSKESEQTLLQGGHTEGPEKYVMMLSITSHQRDANQNHNEIPLHTGDNGHHKQINKQQVLERMWRKGNPSALLVGMQTGAVTMGNFLKKLKMELPFDLAIPLLGLYPKNPETPIQKKPIHPNVQNSTIYNSQVFEAT